VRPAEVVIIGSGTAAEFAARSALGMGAFVKIYDNSVQRLQRLQRNLGVRLYTSAVYPQTLKSADVIIGAKHVDVYQRKPLIDEELISHMRQGSVIVDLNLNCETSELRTLADPTVITNGVIHYSVPNITSRTPQTTSMAISNILGNIILDMGQQGSISHWLRSDADVRNGAYMYNGMLANQYIGNLFGIPFQDIHLLMSAF
jgi:alanine dehydrogenase